MSLVPVRRSRIRGGTSISASNEPLYVIDGVPINNVETENAGIGIGGAPPLPRSPLHSHQSVGHCIDLDSEGCVRGDLWNARCQRRHSDRDEERNRLRRRRSEHRVRVLRRSLIGPEKPRTGDRRSVPYVRGRASRSGKHDGGCNRPSWERSIPTGRMRFSTAARRSTRISHSRADRPARSIAPRSTT